MYDNIMSIKKGMQRTQKEIESTDRKRYDEKLFTEENQQKITFVEIEFKKLVDKLEVETRQEYELTREVKKEDENRVRLASENRELRDALTSMGSYNSSLISQLEIFQRENEEIKDILNRDRFYHELKRNVGDSMKLAREMLLKSVNLV